MKLFWLRRVGAVVTCLQDAGKEVITVAIAVVGWEHACSLALSVFAIHVIITVAVRHEFS